jgi:hypothetical protein
MKARTSARNAPEILFDGRRYPLVRESTGTWRLRSRSKSHPINHGLGTSDLATAKRLARKHLEELPVTAPVKRSTSTTLEDVVQVYASMPKRVGDRAATDNVQRLRTIVRTVTGKELKEVRLSDVTPRLWSDFMAKRLPDGKLDLSTRRPGNAAINSAVKCACSIFIKRLRPSYAEQGVDIPEDITTVQWLPVMSKPPAQADDEALIEWWSKLPVGSDEWLAVGFARFAGLRSSEIAGLRPGWIIVDGDLCFVELRDRPDEGFLTKTGRVYRAIILRRELADAALKLPAGDHVVHPNPFSRLEWFARKLPSILRPYAPSATKPLHRLRGLYADEVARVMEQTFAARLEAVREASRSLGHTSTSTTQNHYLSGTQIRTT